MAMEIPATAGTALGRLSRLWQFVADRPARRVRTRSTHRSMPVRKPSSRRRWTVGHVPFRAPDLYELTREDAEADLTDGWR